MNIAPHDPLPRTSSIIDMLAPSHGGVMGADAQAAGFDRLLAESHTMGPHPAGKPASGEKSTSGDHSATGHSAEDSGGSQPPAADAPHQESMQDHEGQTPPTSESGASAAAVKSADEVADDKEADDEKLGDEANTEAVLVVPQVKLPLEEPIETTASGEDSVASIEVDSAEEKAATIPAPENPAATGEIALRAELRSAEAPDTPPDHSIATNLPASESGEKFLATAEDAEPAADKSAGTSNEPQKEDAEIVAVNLEAVVPAAEEEKSSAGDRRSRRRDDGSASTHDGASKSPRSMAESILEPLAAVGGSESAAAPTALAAESAPPVGASDVAPGGSAPQPAGGANPAIPTPLRLPSEFLTTSARRGGRETGDSPIDAQRILTRVARAFVLAQDGGGGELRLRLSPAELGSLRLEIRVQEGVLTARVETETPAARSVLIENLPALRERLAEQGVRIERFDVDLMQHSPGGTPDHSRQQREPDVTSPIPNHERIRTRPQVAEGVAPRAVMASDLDARRLNIVV
jgi:flagellar hook-length control protein FliK